MKMKTVSCIFSLGLFLVLLRPTFYGTQLRADVRIHPDAGNTSAAFLKLSIGARPISMGNSFVALADDVNALWWNPAGLVSATEKTAGITHNEHFQDIRHEFAGFVCPLGDAGENGDTRRNTDAGLQKHVERRAIGFALLGLYTKKELEGRRGLNELDPYEPLTPVEYYFMVYDIAAQVSYAMRLHRNLDAGCSIKGIQQTIDDVSAWGGAVDAGVLYRHPGLNKWQFGAVVQNAGPSIKFIEKGFPLPLTFRAGMNYRHSDKLTIVSDFVQPIDNYLFVSAGVEYKPIKLLSLRAGYRYRLYGLELGDLSGLSCGLGVDFSGFNLDYAFVPFGALGVSHRLSLSMKIGTVFGKKADAPASAEPAEIRQKPPAPLPILTAEKTKVDLSKIPFVYRPFTAKTNLRDINPSGIAVFRFEIEDSTGGISVIHGTVRSRSFMARVDFEIGEWTPLPGSHVSGMEVVRYFNVKKNFAEEVIGAEITLRLPKADIVRGQGKIYVQLLDGSGTIIEPEISEEGEYLYYRFRLDKLSPFAVVKQGRNPIKN